METPDERRKRLARERKQRQRHPEMRKKDAIPVVVPEPDVIATVPDVKVEPISQNQFRKRYPDKSRSQIREMYQEYSRTGIFPDKDALIVHHNKQQDDKDLKSKEEEISVSELKLQNKKLEKENKNLKDIVEKLKSDLAERSNFYCGIVVLNLKILVRVVVME